MSTNKSHHALQKYLSVYSEKESALLGHIHKKYKHILVIPLYDELFKTVVQLVNSELSTQNLSSNKTQSTLFILVVNCPQGGDKSAADRTIELLHQLKIQAVSQATNDGLNNEENLTYVDMTDGNGMVIVDRCTEGRQIPKKQGVGLARKIGADIACYLISAGVVTSRWIHSTDADVVLPADYFDIESADTHIENKSSITCPIALVYPFIHIPEKDYELAAKLYDWSLRYYVESINWAGSPYAFHTIGSLIAVDFEAYAKVRGFPKRSGGEDFYLLNKLAKIGEIKTLSSPVIEIAARPSQRVPFGTGPALCKMTESENILADYLFYHPNIFSHLKVVCMLINQGWCVGDNLQVQSSGDILGAFNKCLMVDGDIQTITEALDTLGFSDAWRHAVKQSASELQFVKQMTVWFDAFKTLKFIHYMRDHGYPSLPLSGVLAQTTVLSSELCETADSLLFTNL